MTERAIWVQAFYDPKRDRLMLDANDVLLFLADVNKRGQSINDAYNRLREFTMDCYTEAVPREKVPEKHADP